MKLVALFPESSLESKRRLGSKIWNTFSFIKQTFNSFTGSLLISAVSHFLLIFLLSVTAIVY
ncbi:MAG: hypothetical protein C0168_04485 [Candidatus Aminicenantes bacterium]|nr:MAG: hypothetical protein C0168_04485 [Candidatus Aminicenantes bacterium]